MALPTPPHLRCWWQQSMVFSFHELSMKGQYDLIQVPSLKNKNVKTWGLHSFIHHSFKANADDSWWLISLKVKLTLYYIRFQFSWNSDLFPFDLTLLRPMQIPIDDGKWSVTAWTDLITQCRCQLTGSLYCISVNASSGASPINRHLNQR